MDEDRENLARLPSSLHSISILRLSKSNNTLRSVQTNDSRLLHGASTSRHSFMRSGSNDSDCVEHSAVNSL